MSHRCVLLYENTFFYEKELYWYCRLRHDALWLVGHLKGEWYKRRDRGRAQAPRNRKSRIFETRHADGKSGGSLALLKSQALSRWKAGPCEQIVNGEGRVLLLKLLERKQVKR